MNDDTTTQTEPLCKCGVRPAAQCDEEWGPNCDLGNNPAYVRHGRLTEAELLNIQRMIHQESALDIPPAPAIPPDIVPMPQNADQAAGMVLLGTAWLEQHAPERLKAPAPAAQPEPETEAQRVRRICGDPSKGVSLTLPAYSASTPQPEPYVRPGAKYPRLATREMLEAEIDALHKEIDGLHARLNAMATAQTETATKPEAEDFAWLLELFLPDGGRSLGKYHTGFTTLHGTSRSTENPLQAKRYATKEQAEAAARGLKSLQGVWHAIEHGFHAPAAQAEPATGKPDSSATEGGARWQADQHLRALLRYTENFYGVAIAHGMKAGPTANAIAHVESAAKALHALVHAWAGVAEQRTPAVPAQTPTEHCAKGDACVCGGDAPGVRAGCRFWRQTQPVQAPGVPDVETLLTWAVEDGVIKLRQVMDADLQDALSAFARRIAAHPTQPTPDTMHTPPTLSLYGKIMNLLPKRAPNGQPMGWSPAYLDGFGDARLAAAELASEADAELAALRAECERLRSALELARSYLSPRVIGTGGLGEREILPAVVAALTPTERTL